jgi:hypothetical protein
MGIYVDNGLEFVSNGIVLNTRLSLSAGKHNVAVQEWDFCGGATLTRLQLSSTTAVNDSVTVSLPLNRNFKLSQRRGSYRYPCR